MSVLMIFLFTQIISPPQGFDEFVLRIYNNFIPSGLESEDPTMPATLQAVPLFNCIKNCFLVAQTFLSVFNNISPDFSG
jgi:hypothetical protein